MRLRRPELGTLGAIVLCTAVAGGAVAATALRDTESPADPAEVLPSLRGIAQSGPQLGDDGARSSVTVYASLPSLQFEEFVAKDLPEILPLVRRGQVKLLLRPLSEVSEEADATAAVTLSSRAAHAAAVVGDKMWDFGAVFAARYVGVLQRSDLRSMFAAVPGLDVAEADDAMNTARVRRAVREADLQARNAFVESTTTLVVETESAVRKLVPAAEPDHLQTLLAVLRRG